MRGRDRVFDPRGIDVERRRVRLDRHDGRTDLSHREPRGDVRVRRNDHLIAWADAQRLEAQAKRVEPVRNADAVGSADVRGILVLEAGDLIAEEIPSTFEHALQGVVDLAPQLEVRSPEVEKRNLHHLDDPLVAARNSS